MSIETLTKAAVEKDYLGFSKAVDDILKQKTDEHPGVVAYREDMAYYNTLSDTLGTLGQKEPEPDEEV